MRCPRRSQTFYCKLLNFARLLYCLGVYSCQSGDVNQPRENGEFVGMRENRQKRRVLPTISYYGLYTSIVRFETPDLLASHKWAGQVSS